MIIRDDREALEEKAAWIIADAVQDLLEEQERVVLAVPGGRSVSGIFSRLPDESVDWERVHLFMVDERLVPLDDPQSNFLLVMEHLAQAIPEGNVHPFRVERGAQSYEEELEELGGSFDIVLASSGEDGHIAGLYPHHHSVSDEGVFITMDDSPKPPPERMSSSRKLLLRSKVGVVLFFGEAKGEALRRFEEDGPLEECPARIVRRLPQWYALTDQEGG